ncbi:MAG: helix-turn-helix domain-containing protein [Maribacter sp.]|nr:helix-turn-helix domain-containing protein [Maribacter sp.]
MVNSEDFIKRLEQVLQYYGLTAAAFADRIDVQRSSISHLLLGRNKPSLDFVLKVVKNFPEVNLYWFLNGKGTFPSKEASKDSPSSSYVPGSKKHTVDVEKDAREIEKIIIFYKDGSFSSYEERMVQ